jgi:hypothetical protein
VLAGRRKGQKKTVTVKRHLGGGRFSVTVFHIPSHDAIEKGEKMKKGEHGIMFVIHASW